MRTGMGTAALSEGRPDATTLMPGQKAGSNDTLSVQTNNVV